jgi:3-hydroxybutyryl-CoA dehydrogenase
MAAKAGSRRRIRGAIRNTAVIGAGLMGHGIAQVFALGGCKVVLHDVDQTILSNAVEKIRSNLHVLTEARWVSRTSAERALARISTTTDLEEAAARADFVTEAVSEDLELKRRIFERLDAATPEHAILASNTSTLKITAIGVHLRNADRVVTTHWFNPPYLVPVVEVVRGETTSDHTVELTLQFLKKMGKEPVRVLKEVPGFLINRIQTAMFREVLSLLEMGVAEPAEIDRAVMGSFGLRLPIIGPLKTVDLGGLDIWYKGMKYLYPFFDNSKEPQKVMREKVEAGSLGRKTGKGFFEYTSAGGGSDEERERDRKMIKLLALLYPKNRRR